jgi:Co/Zn/Cd efflux system component
MHEWSDGNAKIPTRQKKIKYVFSPNSKLQRCAKRDKIKMTYKRRKTITVLKALMWAVVLAFWELWAMCFTILRCFHREKISRKNIIIDTVKGTNVNIVFVNTRSLETYKKNL